MPAVLQYAISEGKSEHLGHQLFRWNHADHTDWTLRARLHLIAPRPEQIVRHRSTLGLPCAPPYRHEDDARCAFMNRSDRPRWLRVSSAESQHTASRCARREGQRARSSQRSAWSVDNCRRPRLRGGEIPTAVPTSTRQHETPWDVSTRMSFSCSRGLPRGSRRGRLVPKLKVASSNLVSRSTSTGVSHRSTAAPTAVSECSDATSVVL